MKNQLFKQGKRRCLICKEIFPLSNEHFSKNPGMAGGLGYVCKKCMKKYYFENREKLRQNSRIYYKKNQKQLRKYAKEYHLNNIEKVKKYNRSPQRRFQNYKRCAKTANREWNLSFEEFMNFWQMPCHYCNSSIETIGLDRKDNNRGYTIDNIVSCCEYCNKMKLQLSEEDFIKHCKKIVLISHTKRYGYPRFYELLEEMAEIHSQKSHDYGGINTPLANLDEFGWKGVIVRLGDKYFRLKNFSTQEELKVANENIIDTFLDNAIYSLLGIIEFEKWLVDFEKFKK